MTRHPGLGLHARRRKTSSASETAASRESACDLSTTIFALGGNGLRVPPELLKKTGIVPDMFSEAASMEGGKGSDVQEELRAWRTTSLSFCVPNPIRPAG